MKLRTYMKRQWFWYLIAIGAMLISIILDMISPMLTRGMIDDVITAGNLTLLPKLLSGFLVVGFGRAIFQYVKEFTADVIGARIGRDMRKDLFEHIEGMSMDFFSRNNTGELMARVKDDVDKVWLVAGFLGILTLECGVHTIFVITCMVRLSPSLTLIPILVMPVVAVIAWRMETKLAVVYEEISEANASLNTIAQENLAGVRTVKAFAREDFEIGRFNEEARSYYHLNMKSAKALAKHQPLINISTKTLLFLVLLFGGGMVIKGSMSLGDLGAFTEYANNIIWPMELLGSLGNDIASAVASKRKINQIMKETSCIQEEKTAVTLSHVEGNLEFSHVGLTLEGREILKDISFILKPGQTLGIMGVTGAGKTTILNLVERFYDASEGQILLDGEDVRGLSLKTLRGSVAPVLQDVFLFSDSIDENIRIGNKYAIDKDQVEMAARQAMAESFIDHLPEGYDTIVGERGVGLSGGQKQRISIARALSKQTPILILDDATSALDMETENAIQKNLAQWEQTARIIIGHRISSVCHADEILILQDGKIAERGTHKELMEKRGLYFKTYQAQYGEVSVWQ